MYAVHLCYCGFFFSAPAAAFIYTLSLHDALPIWSFATGFRPSSMALADINEDGRGDLVLADQVSDAISLLLGNGDGTFGANLEYGTGSRPVSLAIADLNRDGKLDLAVANYASNELSVLLGHGNSR